MIEQLKIFDGQYNEIGIEQRDTVHTKGYWHEVFHCWVIEKIHSEWHIYFQLRSKNKKDYPNEYDITAAGHLLATESVEDGVRELTEELGIHVDFSQLYSIGVIAYSIDNEMIRDYEFANVFIHEIVGGMDQFNIQREELDGIYRAKLEHFIRLAQDEAKEIEITGYEYENDVQNFKVKTVSLAQMSTLPYSYLKEFIPKLRKMIMEAS
ncbi:NUDIX hydrolase [Solibacillus silvestris]|uniref:NUDIX hydrolase n=1 Tax=Solibacillus silvestris TaxID=76853 RepID=UPI003F80FCA8